jgi:hypothetical protein
VQTKRTLASYKQKKQNGEKFDKVKGSPISIGDCPILLEFKYTGYVGYICIQVKVKGK